MELRRIGKEAISKNKCLNGNQYFISVLKNGAENGLLASQSINTIQLGVAAVLSELIRRYTAGDSSSVRDETASLILSSIYYCIDAYTASLDSPDDLFAVLREKTIKNIYEQGADIVKTCFKKTKKLYEKIADSRLKIPLVTYNDTIDKALPEFFSTYNIEFSAHNTMCSMDYPLAFDDMSIKGIFYIRQYLEKLELETRFCSCFSQKAILRFLNQYDGKFHMDVVNAPINLFEILFDQLIVSVLSGNEKMELNISPLQYELMERELSDKKSNDICMLVKKACNKIISAFQLSDPKLVKYMKAYQKQFTGRLIKACENRNLLNLVIVKGDNSNMGKTVFRDGKRMSDMAFARLVDLIAECESTVSKISLISENIHSVSDYIDLLDSDCIYDDEYQQIFEALSDIELAVLGNSVFYEDLRGGSLDLLPENRNKFKKNVEQDWKRFYIDYLYSLVESRRKQIENLINSMVLNGRG